MARPSPRPSGGGGMNRPSLPTASRPSTRPAGGVSRPGGSGGISGFNPSGGRPATRRSYAALFPIRRRSHLAALVARRQRRRHCQSPVDQPARQLAAGDAAFFARPRCRRHSATRCRHRRHRSSRRHRSPGRGYRSAGRNWRCRPPRRSRSPEYRGHRRRWPPGQTIGRPGGGGDIGRPGGIGDRPVIGGGNRPGPDRPIIGDNNLINNRPGNINIGNDVNIGNINNINRPGWGLDGRPAVGTKITGTTTGTITASTTITTAGTTAAGMATGAITGTRPSAGPPSAGGWSWG